LKYLFSFIQTLSKEKAGYIFHKNENFILLASKSCWAFDELIEDAHRKLLVNTVTYTK